MGPWCHASLVIKGGKSEQHSKLEMCECIQFFAVDPLESRTRRVDVHHNLIYNFARHTIGHIVRFRLTVRRRCDFMF
jgi:hypothetical protein